jgi:hypothetical protein
MTSANRHAIEIPWWRRFAPAAPTLPPAPPPSSAMADRLAEGPLLGRKGGLRGPRPTRNH